MAALIEILLPVTRNGESTYHNIRKQLTETFGGVTLHANAPAEGLWKDGEETEENQIIVVEVMVEDINHEWWRRYRQELEATFGQEEIVIRATPIERL
ncbi:hypothetical protein G6L68_24925 [Agrobacterium fabrum]|uniref:hypothetical protein n=1 Tax=Agrobacterium fabrum TaxID=1176649 RepID=UPI000EF6296D|nr:hypothetical protein [Agrobacterium fabrum]AYM65700.1 hypothetical protein At12D13_45480 [Agrobacterium fabrum]NTE63877.1 hypothetical protein [Agrobacterium fabrum]